MQRLKDCDNIKRKSPLRLGMLAQQKYCELLQNYGLSWTSQLLTAAQKGRAEWLQCIESLGKEFKDVHDNLTQCPDSILSEMNYDIVEDFVDVLALYNKHITKKAWSKVYDGRTHKKVCGDILKSVLTHNVTGCNLKYFFSSFVEELLVSSFDRIKKVSFLYMPCAVNKPTMSSLLANLPLLTNLQEIQFLSNCTKEVIEAIGQHCTDLKMLSVMNSSLVDDSCVEHILKLKDLTFLNICGTAISDEAYGTILRTLPRLINISWEKQIDGVLRNVGTDSLSVFRITGSIEDAQYMTAKCPNIKNLILCNINSDMSHIRNLRSVQEISLTKCNSLTTNFGSIYRHINKTLTILSLCDVKAINMYDIFECNALEKLTLKKCQLTAQGNELFDFALPHFINLKELKLEKNKTDFDLFMLIQHYLNLSVLVCNGVDISNASLENALSGKGLHQISECILKNCKDLNMSTVWLLMRNCPNLSQLGRLTTWSMTMNEVNAVVAYLNSNNFALKVMT